MIRATVTARSLDAVASQAAAVIARGGIVALPTDTLYGLAVDPFNPDAVARLFAAKGRGENRPVPLVAADMAQAEQWLGTLSPVARVLARQYWPGPLTLVVPAPSGLVAAVSAGTGRVGVRVPAHDVPRAVCRVAGFPLTATSANLSGEAPTADPDEVERTLAPEVDLLLDAGAAPGGLASTVVDVSDRALRLVRAGPIRWEDIESCATRR
jgi:L-threonylcarbamoyladenylate synthase